MSDARITLLREVYPQLDDRARSFANSLLTQFTTKGKLSDNQWFYVEKLPRDLAERAAKKAAAKVEAEASAFDLGKLQTLFAKAGENLQRPRIAFSCSAGEFIVSKAGEASRNAGHLYVKAPSGDYLGKVSPEGRFYPAGWAKENYDDVFQALAAFAEDPQGNAAAYGKATGICCFCSRGLTDSRSVEVGYGPICAGNYGLPWGA